MSLQFVLNNSEISTQSAPGMVVLDFLRRDRRLAGTKEGCREGDCGACMVLVGRLQDHGGVTYRAVNSCLLPLGDMQGRHLVTLEGLNGQSLNPIQRAFVDRGASQCGFCTPGFIVSLTGFLLTGEDLNLDGALRAIAGNICRCTGYTSIRRALADILDILQQKGGGSDLPRLIDLGIVPEYFGDIPRRLEDLATSAQQGSGVWVAGGTDLFVQRPEQLLDAPVSFLSRRSDLRGVQIDEKRCWIGAATPVEDLQPDLNDLFPEFDRILNLIASAPIRNRATVGGNIVNASPIADLAILLLVLDTTVHLDQEGGQRTVPLQNFFRGYKTLDLQEGELVVGFSFPLPAGGFRGRFNFEKVSRRTHLDIASVNSALFVEREGERIRTVRLSAGGVAPVPLLLQEVADTIEGTALNADTIRRAAERAVEATAPISDARGSAGYKKLLLRQLIYAHFLTLFPQNLSLGELL